LKILHITFFTNHNNYNFADSIRQHYKKHIVIEIPPLSSP